MNRPYIPAAIRVAVAQAARNRCGYCLTQSRVVGTPLTINHIIPLSEDGTNDESNLWLACSWCNNHKAARTKALDPQGEVDVPIFNPRQQEWYEHFRWTDDGVQVIGLSATGRATIEALQLNNSYVIDSRTLWVAAGWHPPQD